MRWKPMIFILAAPWLILLTGLIIYDINELNSLFGLWMFVSPGWASLVGIFSYQLGKDDATK